MRRPKQGPLFTALTTTTATSSCPVERCSNYQKGSSSFLHFFVSGVEEDGQPGIQWDGTYIAMQETGVRRKSPLNIYQVQISGSTGVLVDTLTLTNRSNNSPFRGTQFWIGDGTLVSPEAPNKNVGLWHYPKGGKAYRTVKVNETGGNLMALTVSKAAEH